MFQLRPLVGYLRTYPMDLTRTAYGTWSGGRFMHFGEALDDQRYEAIITPGVDIRTVLTADAYGAGEADTRLGAGLRKLFAGELERSLEAGGSAPLA